MFDDEGHTGAQKAPSSAGGIQDPMPHGGCRGVGAAPEPTRRGGRSLEYGRTEARASSHEAGVHSAPYRGQVWRKELIGPTPSTAGSKDEGHEGELPAERLQGTEDGAERTAEEDISDLEVAKR